MNKRLFYCLAAALLMMLVVAAPPPAQAERYYDGYFTNVLVKGKINYEKAVGLPLTAFTKSDGTPLSNSGAGPRLEMIDGVLNIVWEDGNDSPVEVTFQVPRDYVDSGKFNIVAADSDETDSPNQVDFDTYVFTPGEAMPDSDSPEEKHNENPVLISDASLGREDSPEEVELTPSDSPWENLQAGDVVKFKIWRHDGAEHGGSRAALRVKTVAFYYK